MSRLEELVRRDREFRDNFTISMNDLRDGERVAMCIIDLKTSAESKPDIVEFPYDKTLTVLRDMVIELRLGGERLLVTTQTRQTLTAEIKSKGEYDVISFRSGCRINLSRIWLETYKGVKYYLGKGVMDEKMQWIVRKDAPYKLCSDEYSSWIIKQMMQ